MGVGLAVGAGAESGGEQAAGFVAVDGAQAGAFHVAVAGVDLDRRVSDADVELDDPVRWPGTAAPAVFLFGLPLPYGCDLRVDALQPHGVPHPQGVETFQVGRQVIERIFDSMLMIHASHLACSISCSIAWGVRR